MSTRNPPTPRQAPPATPSLSRERIAAAALRLVDRDGLDALSMRRLAAELGAGTMTLYGYFRDKDELLDAVVDAVAADSPHWGERREGWRDQLAQIARSLREGLERHPALIQLRLRRPIVSAGAMRGTESGLSALVAAGLSPEEAARCFRTLFLYTFGFVAFSAGGSPRELRLRTRAAVDELPAEEYPMVTAAAGELAATLSGDEQFEFGLHQLLDGIQARLPAR